MKLLINYLNNNEISLDDYDDIEKIFDKSKKLTDMLKEIILLDDDEIKYSDKNISLLLTLFPEDKIQSTRIHVSTMAGEACREYVRQIANNKVLSKEEEYELAKRIENGDNDARNLLIEANLKLVVRIALTYKYNEHNIMDFIEDGNEGLIKAVDNYDYHN